MQPVVLDLRGADDSRDVVHRAVQALVEGQLVAFPTETGYVLAASALAASGVERMLSWSRGPDPVRLYLALKSADEALDYVPHLSLVGQRLARRCWPGPVTLVVDDSDPESLIRQLPSRVQQALAPAGQVCLRVPAHTALTDAARLLAGPVVFAPASHPGEPESLTAQDVVAAVGDRVQLIVDDGRSRYGQPPSMVLVRGRELELLQVGVVPEVHLARLSSLMILFVCTGNTCRSPMAEMLCRQMLAEKLGCQPGELEQRGVLVASAGVAAMLGGRASPEAVTVMSQAGLNLADHESQPISATLIKHADYILAMTRSHRQAILADWPEAADRVHLLCQDRSDIPDPIGGPPELYLRCAERMRRELTPWVARWNL